MIKLLFITIPLFAMLCACSSPAEVISKHFAAMNDIAVSNQNNCDEMGNALLKYLDENTDSFKEAVLNTGSSEASQAQEIYRASTALHISTENCNSASIISFRKKLSEIVLLTAN